MTAKRPRALGSLISMAALRQMRPGDGPPRPSTIVSHSTRSAGPAKRPSRRPRATPNGFLPLPSERPAGIAPLPVPRRRFPHRPPGGRCAIPGEVGTAGGLHGNARSGRGKGREPVDARDNERRGGGAWRGWLPAVLAAASLGASGCGGTFWDTVTRRDFTMNMLYQQARPAGGAARQPGRRRPGAGHARPARTAAERRQSEGPGPDRERADDGRQERPSGGLPDGGHLVAAALQGPAGRRRPERRLLRGRQFQPRDGDDPALPGRSTPSGRPASRPRWNCW